MKRRFILLGSAGLLLGIGIPLVLGGQELLPVLARVNGLHLLGMLGIIVLAWNFNAGRVRLLVGGMDCCRLDQRQALGVIIATEFAYSITPGGSGGPPTYSYLLHRHGLSVSHGLAVYTVDMLIDMLFFLTALLAILVHVLLVPSDLHYGWQLLVLGGLLIAGLVGFILVVRHFRRLILLVGRLLRRLGVQSRIRRRIMRRLLEYRHGLLKVRRYPLRRLLSVYALCAGHWLLRYSILYLAVRELGGRIDWNYAFMAQMVSLTLGHATLLPGGSGGAEASASVLLLPYLDAATAAGAILIWRFVTFYWYLIAGAPVFALLAGRPVWQRLIKGEMRNSELGTWNQENPVRGSDT